MSIDKIKEELEQEVARGERERAPSRGAIQNVVAKWEEKPWEIRVRDIPFRWHQLDLARIPWEASDWVLGCSAAHYQGRGLHLALYMNAESEKNASEYIATALGAFGPFTNRLAAWCWRVHLARPDWPSGEVLPVANLYSRTEQANDLLLSQPDMNMDWLDQYLEFRPDASPESAFVYSKAIEFRMVEPIPESIHLDRPGKVLKRSGRRSREGGWLVVLHDLWDSWSAAMEAITQAV